MNEFEPPQDLIRNVEIVDTTGREGLQTPLLEDNYKYYLTAEDKLEIYRGLMAYGVCHFEVFSPVVNGIELSDIGIIFNARKQHE